MLEGQDLVVAALVPSGNTWSARMGMSVAGLTAYFYCTPVQKGRPQALMFKNKRGSILPQLRQKMVQEVLDLGVSHILFIDSDQCFEPDILHRLLAWKKPIVACNVATKSFPTLPTARLEGHQLVYTTPNSPACKPVWRVGCGIMLIESWVFSLLQKPWFDLTWLPEVDDFQGEDWYFCQKAQAAGIEVCVDHRASISVGHAGEYVFTHKDVWESLNADTESGLISKPDGLQCDLGTVDSGESVPIRIP